VEEVYYSSVSSPLGTIWFASDSIGVCLLKFGLREKDFLEVIWGAEMEPRSDSAFTRGASEEIRAYFEGELTQFATPVHPRGSTFDMKVWTALRRIPLGETRSYQEIAQEVGNPRACRAVGGANRRNPIPLFIPCHRVIKKNGGLGGFSSGAEIKEWLLQFEQGVPRNQQ
jgi:O-6-methylguanine DNA methyltransferase